MRRALPLLLASPALLGMQADPKISEVRLDSLPPFTNLEYIELTGLRGASLDGLALIVIGDAGSEVSATCGDSGVIESVTPLDGAFIPDDRVFLACSEGSVLANVDLIRDLQLEDADNLTVLLVRGSSAFVGQDLDTNNDGVLDVVPWKSVVDGVSFVWRTPGVGSEYAYDPHVVALTSGLVLFGARRCLDSDAWIPLDPRYPDPHETAGALNPYCLGSLCFADLNSDFAVGPADLAIVLSNWGAIGTRGDANLDGLVDAFDLAAVLTQWGPCDP